jgi:NADH dehydrogenase (ubiquinone) 1 alpha subcomplex subunit 13
VYKKSIPTKGPGNIALLGGVGAVLAYGWFFTLDSIWMRNRLKVEEYDVRMSLLPYLQAEEDQRYVEVRAVLDAKEAELMADVPGWQVNKPNFDTIDWVRPKALPY